MTARLYDLCAYRASLMGRNPPRGEAEAAQARAELRAISELERFARAVRVVCCDAPVEVEVRGGPK